MRVEFKGSFLKSIKKIRNEQLKLNIADIIEQVEKANDIRHLENIKPLRGYKNFYRIKLNSYQIGLEIKGSTVIFVAFADRKDIYRRFP